MIKSFRHKGLEKFYVAGSLAGIQPKHAARIDLQLDTLNIASSPEDMNVAGWNLHELKGDQVGIWSIKVNGNWRLTFGFDGKDAVLVNYVDYH